MHAHNLLHRDLKTANIFLTKEGLVKIGDFGISKMLTTRAGGGANTVLGNILIYRLYCIHKCTHSFICLSNAKKIYTIIDNIYSFRYSILH
jgi:serine/threonine protein kinase